MQKDILEVKNILKKHMETLIKNYNIKLIYIFGSYAKGSNNDNSDLDIAVSIEGEPDYLTKLDIIYDLVGILNREDIDLVILNDVDEILKFQIIKYGEIIYMQDLYTKVVFEASVMKEYMDKEYFRDTQYKYSHDNFLEKMELKNI